MHLMVIEGTCATVIRGTARQITSAGCVPAKEKEIGYKWYLIDLPDGQVAMTTSPGHWGLVREYLAASRSDAAAYATADFARRNGGAKVSITVAPLETAIPARVRMWTRREVAWFYDAMGAVGAGHVMAGMPLEWNRRPAGRIIPCAKPIVSNPDELVFMGIDRVSVDF